MGQNGFYHVSVGDMHTGTLHVLTETPINEVPADSSRASVHLWRIRTALKEPQWVKGEVKGRSDK
jgi:hypothetical protein